MTDGGPVLKVGVREDIRRYAPILKCENNYLEIFLFYREYAKILVSISTLLWKDYSTSENK